MLCAKAGFLAPKDFMSKDLRQPIIVDFLLGSVLYPFYHTIHYEEVEKLGSKWSTSTNHFSTDFCTKGLQFLTEMSKLPENLKKMHLKSEKYTSPFVVLGT